jgi:mannan endo-1,4-beta-mannosidase
VFRLIVDYLRNERGLDNLLFAYAPDRLDLGFFGNLFTDLKERYLIGYPGDGYVDVLGIDLYYAKEADFSVQATEYREYLELISQLATERGKVAALTETGNYRLADETTAEQSRWYTEQLLPMIRDNPKIRLAWVLTWENRSNASRNFYVPFPGHPGVDDFRAFHADRTTLFLSDVDGLYAKPRELTGHHPTCTRCDSDPDRDGWGWENEASCMQPSWCLPPEEFPTCMGCDSDPDADGWGWENERSCRISPACK